MVTLIPDTEDRAVESSLITEELTAGVASSHDTVVDIVAAATASAVETLPALLPGEGVAGAAEIGETVGALAVVGNEYKVVVAAGAYDDTVVGAEGYAGLVLLGGSDEDGLGIAVEVTHGVELSVAVAVGGFDGAEVPCVAEDARELAGQWME